MSGAASQVFMTGLLVFCRVGGCIMFMPGLSSARVPVRVRLYIALTISLAIVPLVADTASVQAAREVPHLFLLGIVSELAVGLVIGLSVRVFYLSLQFATAIMASAIGYNAPPAPDIDDGEATSSIASVVTMAATLLFFLADLHIDFIKAFVESFSVLPAAGGVDREYPLVQLVDVLGRAFALALQIASPFIIYAFMVNVLLGVINRMIAQLPVQMVATPVVLLGGLMLLALFSGGLLLKFDEGLSRWLLSR